MKTPKTVSPPPADLTGQTFEGALIPLPAMIEARLAVGKRDIRGVEFTDCVIRGPGILVPGPDSNFIDSNLGDVEGDVRNIFLRAEGPLIIGAINADGCQFLRCQFVGVGFSGDNAFIDQFVTLLSAKSA